MPAEIFGPGYAFLPKPEILTHEEIARSASAFSSLGVEKLRITGGEPLLRRGLSDLVAMLSEIPGHHDLAITTNGVLLGRHANSLKEAGLHRVTVSLDALSEEVFSKMNGVGASPDKVIAGVDAAISAGLGVKINCVVQKGVNEQEVLPLAEFARDRGVTLRFIEFMDTGNTNRWQLDQVVPSADLLEKLKSRFDLEASQSPLLGETAKRYQHVDQPEVEIGFISSVSQPFCRDCNRARLSADGQIFTCLFAEKGHDLKSLLRSGATDAQLADEVSRIWHRRSDRYSEIRAEGGERTKPEMSYIGG
ncbi:cyclic pyranopterin monophosphate synthase [Oceaniferula spumae]|uniref:Cyclic pyranopterin monophosphate synthase n=1 Tax=Oceaniferula spumae TaxID=2979115 RepID=A0AAT9FPZ6_9BACT